MCVCIYIYIYLYVYISRIKSREHPNISKDFHTHAIDHPKNIVGSRCGKRVAGIVMEDEYSSIDYKY